MTRTAYTIFIISLLGVFAAFHLFSMKFALYWSFADLDSFMHFFGGFLAGSVGVLSVSAAFFRKKQSFFERKKKYFHSTAFVFGLSALSALLIGVIWECYELWSLTSGFYYDVFGVWSVRDMISDLVFDLLGGVFAGSVFALFVNKK